MIIWPVLCNIWAFARGLVPFPVSLPANLSSTLAKYGGSGYEDPLNPSMGGRLFLSGTQNTLEMWLWRTESSPVSQVGEAKCCFPSDLTQSPLGSCLDPCRSSMARKLPGGQQVATGVLEEEAKGTKKKTDSKTSKLAMVFNPMRIESVPLSQLRLSYTAHCSLLLVTKTNWL